LLPVRPKTGRVLIKSKCMVKLIDHGNLPLLSISLRVDMDKRKHLIRDVNCPKAGSKGDKSPKSPYLGFEIRFRSRCSFWISPLSNCPRVHYGSIAAAIT
jgi:hypothetical protein